MNVTVSNSAPGGGTSGAQTFTVNNAVPTVTILSPSSATAPSKHENGLYYMKDCFSTQGLVSLRVHWRVEVECPEVK